MTLPEVLLWNLLRPKVNTRCTIRRQVPILKKYVLDFYCPQRKIAFEIDGFYIHEDQEEKDAERQQAIEELGITFVRISAARVLKYPNEVAETIIKLCIGELQVSDLE